MYHGNVRSYYSRDAQGSTANLTDSTGSVVESYTYDEYGNVNAPSQVGNRYLYTGREYDPETGLYSYRARYYDPTIGRFLQTDPIGYEGGINPYAYVKNNPINFKDSTGLWQVTVGAAAGYGGQISFGYNGGQWNFGGNVGLGEGAWGSYSGIDSGSHESGTFGSDDASATDGSWSISTQIDTSGNGSMCVDYNNPENGLGGEVSVDEGTGNVSVGPSWSFGDGTFIGPGLVTYGPDGKPADNAGNPGDSDTGDGSGGSDGGYYPSGGEGKCCCDCCISLIPQSGGSSPSSASSSHSHGRTRRMRPRDLQHIMRTQERVHIRMDE